MGKNYRVTLPFSKRMPFPEETKEKPAKPALTGDGISTKHPKSINISLFR